MHWLSKGEEFPFPLPLVAHRDLILTLFFTQVSPTRLGDHHCVAKLELRQINMSKIILDIPSLTL